MAQGLHVAASEGHTRVPHSKLRLGQATNLAWATQQCSVASTMVLRGTKPKMPRMCEVINGLYCS